MKTILAGSLLLLFIIATPAISESETEESKLIAALEKSLSEPETMKARFIQTMTSKGFGAVGKESGFVYLSRPGKMRWDYDQPKGKTLLVDGQTVWYFDPATSTLNSYPARKHLDPRSPALFLVGQGKLSELFDIHPIPGKNSSDNENIRLKLTPKKAQPGVKGMILEVTKEIYLLAGLTIVDHLGNRNSFKFTNLVLGEKLPDELFIFEPPDGAKLQ